MTKEACQSRDCCYNERYTPGAQDAPECYYPANAEIDAYFQTTMTAEGEVPCIFCQTPTLLPYKWLLSAGVYRVPLCCTRKCSVIIHTIWMPMVPVAFKVKEYPLSRAALAATLGSASPFAGFEGYNCSWGPPTLQPTSRWNDTWGMGWDNLFEVEVMEMRAADLTQARPYSAACA